MKKAISIYLILIASIGSISFNEVKSYPPIQKFLDKIKSADNYTEPTKVSQRLTANTFIVTLDNPNIKWKETYSGIDWKDFSRYSYNEFKDYFVVEFYFYDDIAFQLDDEEFGVENEDVNSFQCEFLPEDKDEVLEVLKTWEENRND